MKNKDTALVEGSTPLKWKKKQQIQNEPVM
jgi:hypothetical protein